MRTIKAYLQGLKKSLRDFSEETPASDANAGLVTPTLFLGPTLTFSLSLLLLCPALEAADSNVGALVLTLELDCVSTSVSDPLFARIVLENDSAREIRFAGVLPSVDGGTLGIQYRPASQMEWASFVFGDVTIEPGAVDPDAEVVLGGGKSIVYYKCVGYHIEYASPPATLRHQYYPALREPGKCEFRAIARIGKLVVHSQPVVVNVQERSESELVALDLVEPLIRETVRLDRPGIPWSDTELAQKVIKYLPNSNAGWLLDWKLNWATWMEDEDLLKPKAALERIVTMRDNETGIRREILTASLAHGFVKLKKAQRAREEAEQLPEGAFVRRLLMAQIADLERRPRGGPP